MLLYGAVRHLFLLCVNATGFFRSSCCVFLCLCRFPCDLNQHLFPSTVKNGEILHHTCLPTQTQPLIIVYLVLFILERLTLRQHFYHHHLAECLKVNQPTAGGNGVYHLSWFCLDELTDNLFSIRVCGS